MAQGVWGQLEKTKMHCRRLFLLFKFGFPTLTLFSNFAETIKAVPICWDNLLKWKRDSSVVGGNTVDKVKILTLTFLETIMGFVLETRPSKSERVFKIFWDFLQSIFWPDVPWAQQPKAAKSIFNTNGLCLQKWHSGTSAKRSKLAHFRGYSGQFKEILSKLESRKFFWDFNQISEDLSFANLCDLFQNCKNCPFIERKSMQDLEKHHWCC